MSLHVTKGYTEIQSNINRRYPNKACPPPKGLSAALLPENPQDPQMSQQQAELLCHLLAVGSCSDTITSQPQCPHLSNEDKATSCRVIMIFQ